jgi:hypothetical protein
MGQGSRVHVLIPHHKKQYGTYAERSGLQNLIQAQKTERALHQQVTGDYCRVDFFFLRIHPSWKYLNPK